MEATKPPVLVGVRGVNLLEDEMTNDERQFLADRRNITSQIKQIHTVCTFMDLLGLDKGAETIRQSLREIEIIVYQNSNLIDPENNFIPDFIETYPKTRE
jgi:hypothetical protein